MEEKTCDWRARIGILTPACCPNQVCEWKGNLPDGVTFHEAIMGMVENNPEGLLALKEKAVIEGKKLADGLMDIILFACTSGSFIGGPATIKPLSRSWRQPQASGLPPPQPASSLPLRIWVLRTW
jgi:maleate isomerase